MTDDIPDWVGYIRLSQTGDLQRQENQILDYADQHDLPLSRENILSDGEQASGFEYGERPEWERIVEWITNGDIKGIIVRDTDRLTREPVEYMRVLPSLAEHGIELHSVDEGRIETEDSMMLGMEAVKSAARNQSKKNDIEHARQAIEKKLEQGGHHGSTRFGYRYSDDKMKQVPDRETGEFYEALRIIERREEGATYDELEEEFEPARGTIVNIVKHNREHYLEDAEDLDVSR